MRWRTVTAAVALAGFLLAACGDDSGTDDNASGNGSSAETDSGNDGSSDSSPENGGDDQNGEGENAAAGSGGQFCQDLVTYVKEYNEVLTTTFEGSSPPEDVSTDTFESLGDVVRSGAPAEIADDVEVTSQQMDLMVAGMTGDVGANDELMAADPGSFQAAAASVQDYAKNTCGFDPEGYFDANPVPIE